MTEVEMDKKMFSEGKVYKINLPEGMGEPIYTANFSGACEMVKEYGKGTRVIDLRK